MSHPTLSDWLLLATLVLIWGTSFLFTKIAALGVPPATVVAGRLSIAAITLVVLVRAAGLRLPRDRALWRRFLTLGLLGNALPFFLITWGQQRIDSAVAGILMAIMPLATLLLAHFFVDGERLTGRRAGGFATGFAGIVVLMGPDALRELGGGSSRVVGQLAVLGGALCYAVNAILARRLPGLSALVVSASVMIVASLLVVPFGAARLGAPTPLATTPAAVLSVVWLGFVSTAAATIVFFRIVASAGPTFVSLINYFIPVVATVTGVLVLGEQLPARAYAALGVILFGIAVSQRR